jgi:hypothetical protein
MNLYGPPTKAQELTARPFVLTRTQFVVDLVVTIGFGIITLLVEADVFGGPNVRGFFKVGSRFVHIVFRSPFNPLTSRVSFPSSNMLRVRFPRRTTKRSRNRWRAMKRSPFPI